MANLLLRGLFARDKKDVMSQENDSKIEQKLVNWSMPKFRKNQIYKTPIFRFNRSDHSYMIKTVENHIVLKDSYTNVPILDSNIVNQHVRNYNEIHLGLVQVSAKPLTKLKFDFPILITLRDKRFLIFRDSVRAVLESNLRNGPSYFNCSPSHWLCIHDSYITECVVLDIKIPSEVFINEGSIPPVSIMYRFCYMVGNNCRGPETRREYKGNETEVIQISVQNSSIKTSKRLIKHDQVTFPEEWLQTSSSSHESQT